MRWWLTGAVLCAAVFAVLPGGQVRLGAAQLQGLVGSYQYERTLAEDCYVDNLRVGRVGLSPTSIEIEWDYEGFLPAQNVVYEVKRVDPNNTETILGETSETYYFDNSAHTLGSR
jgi:hypothetical protein